MNKYSIGFGVLGGLVFGILFLYSVASKSEIRTHQNVDFVAYCTIQIQIETDEYIHYKTVIDYPVSVYKIETSRHGIVTYHGHANNRFLRVDKNACNL